MERLLGLMHDRSVCADRYKHLFIPPHLCVHIVRNVCGGRPDDELERSSAVIIASFNLTLS